jgi:hypothetical protein
VVGITWPVPTELDDTAPESSLTTGPGAAGIWLTTDSTQQPSRIGS